MVSLMVTIMVTLNGEFNGDNNGEFNGDNNGEFNGEFEGDNNGEIEDAITGDDIGCLFRATILSYTNTVLLFYLVYKYTCIKGLNRTCTILDEYSCVAVPKLYSKFRIQCLTGLSA